MGGGVAIRNGEMERVTGDVEMVTGAAPMSFGQWLAGRYPSMPEPSR